MGGRGVERLMETLLLPGFEDVHLVLMGMATSATSSGARPDRRAGTGESTYSIPCHRRRSFHGLRAPTSGQCRIPGMTRNDIFSSPNKLFECFAAGTPVVASNFPTMRRFIVDNPGGPLGAVCDASRVESIGDAILSV